MPSPDRSGGKKLKRPGLYLAARLPLQSHSPCSFRQVARRGDARQPRRAPKNDGLKTSELTPLYLRDVIALCGSCQASSNGSPGAPVESRWNTDKSVEPARGAVQELLTPASGYGLQNKSVVRQRLKHLAASRLKIDDLNMIQLTLYVYNDSTYAI